MENVHVATHPLISHKMTLLRNVKTSPADFRRLLREVTFYLGYEVSCIIDFHSSIKKYI